jgi:hypothetical protein
MSSLLYTYSFTGAVCSLSEEEVGDDEPDAVPWDEIEDKFKKFR